MPVARLTRRRRSSLGIALSTPVRPGTYGITTSPRLVTFAPNVTPGTFIEETEGSDDPTVEPPSPSDALFPPAEVLAPSTTRRRAPPGKRRSQGYIPRPPNAFMLFRANFVRQKHVPGSIETNHGSLSKIIGNCWKALPEAEKKVWDARAKKAKAEHQKTYPNYRFRPVHNKNKKNKSKVPVEPSDERRCEEVAALLLEGKKGEELAAAVRRLDLDRAREATGSQSPMPMLHAPIPMSYAPPMFAQHRRPSSVPPPSLYHPISIPTMPFFPQPQHQQQDLGFVRPESPLTSIARSQRMLYGQRRASSAEPRYYDNWGMLPTMHSTPLNPADLQTDHEPLPDVNADLFNPSYLGGADNTGFGMHDMFGTQQQVGPTSNPALALQISPFDNLDNGLDSASTWSTSVVTPADPLSNPWASVPPTTSYEGHSAAGSPSAQSTPPPEVHTPPHTHMGMGMYGAVPDYTTAIQQQQQQQVAVAEDYGMYTQQVELGGMTVGVGVYAQHLEGDVGEYQQSCLDQQVYGDMSGMHHHHQHHQHHANQYMQELEVQY